MPEYLYRLQATRPEMLSQGPTDREARLVGEHFAYLKRLAAEGRVLMAGRTLDDNERTFGIVVFVADSEPAAAQIVERDPAVGHGVMSAELFPFRIALWSPRGPSDEGHPA